MEAKIYYFEKPGPKNTEATLKIARQRTKELGIKQIILASTHGETARKALEVFRDMDVEIIVVYIPHTFEKFGHCMDSKVKKELEEKGATVITTLCALGGDVNDAFVQTEESNTPNVVVGKTLKRFSQGMKVCVEIVLMATDTGIIDMDKEIIAIAGSTNGADTAVVVKPAYPREFMHLWIREILAKPR